MGISKARAATVAVGLGLCLTLLASASALAAEPGGIAGRVVESEELEGMNGVEVCAEAVFESSTPLVCDETEGGSYEILGLEAGQYRVHFVPIADTRYVPQYYLRTYRVEKARLLQIEAGSVKSGVSAALELGGWVTGRVTDEAGNSLSDVEVCFVNELLPELELPCVKTEVEGKYETERLPPGPYWAFFSAPEERGIFPGESEGFVVEGYNETPEVDAELELAVAIKGSVTEAASGLPLEGIRACALALGSEVELRCALSGADGSYAIYGLHAGSYVVGFSVTRSEAGIPIEPDDGFVRQYYEDQPSFDAANVIDATEPGLYRDIDAHLTRGAEVFPRPPVASIPAASTPAEPIATPAPPSPPKLVCRKHFRKKLVNGKRRCVRMPRHHHRPHSR
ncbi:MAG: carboxypeptidase-like regulatory domain-containing protein [Solirubrobacterales bacterium]